MLFALEIAYKRVFPKKIKKQCQTKVLKTNNHNLANTM